MSFRIFTRRTIILNTWKAASDLLESRSKLYSDRPTTWMYHELIGRKLAVFNISSLHPRFSIYRKLLHTSLNPRVIQAYDDLQDKESRILLSNLKAKPENFAKHFRRCVAWTWWVSMVDVFPIGTPEQSFCVWRMDGLSHRTTIILSIS